MTNLILYTPPSAFVGRMTYFPTATCARALLLPARPSPASSILPPHSPAPAAPTVTPSLHLPILACFSPPFTCLFPLFPLVPESVSLDHHRALAPRSRLFPLPRAPPPSQDPRTPRREWSSPTLSSFRTSPSHSITVIRFPPLDLGSFVSQARHFPSRFRRSLFHNPPPYTHTALDSSIPRLSPTRSPPSVLRSPHTFLFKTRVFPTTFTPSFTLPLKLDLLSVIPHDFVQLHTPAPTFFPHPRFP